MTDPYQVLGVQPSATDEEVKAAYRNLAKRYHPDRNNGSPEAEKMMMRVNEAYAQVMDIRKNGGASTNASGGYGGGYAGGQGGYGGYGQQQGGYGQRQSGYGDFGGFGFGFDPFGGGRARQGAPQFSTVRQYLAMGRYRDAAAALEQMSARGAEWYYLSARARQGMGDDIAALNFARQAVNMDPANQEYIDFVDELTAGGQEYRTHGFDFGGMQSALCRNPCLTCLLFNLCCGGGCGGMRCCMM